MSNVGQTVLTVVGTVVGFAFGYPALGFYLGNLAGQAFFPTQLPGVKGPTLDDLTVQGSAIGIPVPIVYGTYAIAGNIIWSTDLIPTTTTETVGGKGGPTQKVSTTTYAVNFAVGLCNNEAFAIRRIWAGGKLIYDRRPQQPGEDSTTYASRENAADLFDTGMTFYTGAEDQLPDPTIEAWEGVGNVPAFRGLCYVVFTNFQLEDYGNNLAGTALRFELVCGGAIAFEETTSWEQPITFEAYSTPANPYNPRNNYSVGWRVTYHTGDSNSSSVQQTDILSNEVDAYNALSAYLQTYRLWPAPTKISLYGQGFPSRSPPVSLNSRTSFTQDQVMSKAVELRQLYFPSDEIDIDFYYDGSLLAGSSEYEKIHALTTANGHPNGTVIYVENMGQAPSLYKKNATLFTVGSTYWRPASGGYLSWIIDSADGSWWHKVVCPYVWAWIEPRPPEDPCNPQGLPPYPDSSYTGFCIINGVITESKEYTGPFGSRDLPNGTIYTKCLQSFLQRAHDSDRSLSYPWGVGPVINVVSPNFNDSAFWQAAYADAVAAGLMPSGLTYGVDYPTSPTTDNDFYELTIQRGSITEEPPPLSYVVGDICSRAGLLSTQYDVADLTKTLNGYAIGTLVDGATAIQPLRPYGLFDAVESEGKIKFVTRGKAAVATLTVDDLGAHVAGDNAPSLVEVTRVQDVELPRVIRVRYAQKDKDYETGEQSQSRLRTTANQIADVEIPVSMTDDEAAQLADINLFEQWAGRNSYAIQLTYDWLALEPTDVINVPVDGALERMRLVDEDFAVPGIKRLQLRRDDDYVYVSYVTGVPSSVVSGEVAVLEDSVAYYLNLPALRDADDNAGYYIGARPTGGTSWPGAQLLRSSDAGASYSDIGSIIAAAISGTLDAALPTGPSTIVDEGNVLEVTLDRGTLESVSDLGLDAGQNAAAIGAEGRWEIIQFRTATLITGNTWELSGLLRGRRGTEHAIGTSQLGDTFIMLDQTIPVAQDVASINVVKPHKPVTFGLGLDTGTVTNFAGTGEALRPFSPVHLSGSRDGSSNLTIAWIRRGRIGRELPSASDIPLSEETEAYEIDIMDGSAVVRTLTSTVQNVSYTAAQQTTDFGSPQASVTVAVYQMSATVGRGYPLEGTV